MSDVNGKRITFKRTRPNPLFNDWLVELHEEAKQKGSKLESMLKEARSSISKYPLPLQSGAECAILKGFDKRLCLFLDKRLEVYKSLNKECAVDTCSKSSASSVSGDENDAEPDILESYKSKSTSNTSSEMNKDITSTSSNCPPKQNGKKITYKPTFRSGTYALLMALVHLKKNEPMSKAEIIVAAQKYCEGDINREWRNMTILKQKGLVIKTIKKNKSWFSLTDEGISVAKELYEPAHKKATVDDIVSIENASTHNNHVKNKCTSEVIVIEHAKTIPNNVDNQVKTINGTETAVLLDNCTNNGVTEDIEEHVDYSLIEMEPGSFDIILLIDKNETSGLTKKNDPTVTQFNKYPELKHEYRSLKVGDFTWIARNKINKEQELVLPYVVERKRMDDLAQSIKDGRFHEQKFRLRKCGLNHVIYMVENHGSNKHVGMPMQSLMQALANTRVQDGFKVQITESLVHSVRFLATMTLRLMYEYKDKSITGHNGDSKADILMTFGHFNKSSVKNRALSVTDTFIKLLLQLKGVSVEKALTITNEYKTPRLLIEKYKGCDQREGEMLLANLKFGGLNRSVGPSVSKSVYQLFTFRNVK